MDANKAESNLREFMKKHGREGFVKLLLTNYLFELVMYYLHSGKNPSAQVSEDTSYRFYVDGQERVYPPEQIERFKRDLRFECQKKASLVVKTLREMDLIEKLSANFMEEPRVARLMQRAFKSITQRT